MYIHPPTGPPNHTNVFIHLSLITSQSVHLGIITHPATHPSTH